MEQSLTPEDRRLLARYREQIRSLSYTPLSEAQLRAARRRRVQARASAAIEGLCGTPVQEALFDLFEELRVPGDVCEAMLDAFADDRLTHASRL